MEEIKNTSAQKDFQDAYEKEHYKAVYLANRVAELEDQVDDLQFKLDRIKLYHPAEGPAEKLRQPFRCGSEDAVQGMGKKGDDPLRNG